MSKSQNQNKDAKKKKSFLQNKKLLVFTENGWSDYLSWVVDDQNIVKKINDLIESIKRTHFAGIGKPEPLKFDLKEKWSRRINSEHRLVYEINENHLIIYACKYHY